MQAKGQCWVETSPRSGDQDVGAVMEYIRNGAGAGLRESVTLEGSNRVPSRVVLLHRLTCSSGREGAISVP